MTKFARSSCCLMLALLLCLSFCSVGYATEVNSSLTPSQTSQLLSIVSDLEPQKSMLGLSNVDFNNLYLGEPIQTYIYTNDTFVKSHDLFPVLYNNTIVFWAYDNNGNIQISAGLSSKITVVE